ncbi:MAG: ABC transporter permease, partial [Pigmentiphaga sp.]
MRITCQVLRHRISALLLVTPLLVFLAFSFVAPIGTMLFRSVHNPGVAQLIPGTLEAMDRWRREGLPPEETRTAFAVELRALFDERRSGRLGEAVNRVMPGASSTIQSTGRRLSGMAAARVEADGATLLSGINATWNDTRIWLALHEAGRNFTGRNFLAALDLERAPDGAIQARTSARIYIDLYVKTLRMALIITLLTLALGYPLAFFLAHQRSSRANLLMIFVLLPFWTSLLVRTTAWITLLQTHGVVNSTLLWLGVIDQPLTLLYTELATVLAMTHILLPFMVLPLYAVMRGIDPSS